MKFCGNCGTSTGDDSCFCGNCGYRFPDVVSTVESEAETETTSAYDKFVDFLYTYIGNDKKAELNWKTLFTDVFNRHSREEAEDIFIVGTKNTTPTVQEVQQEPITAPVVEVPKAEAMSKAAEPMCPRHRRAIRTPRRRTNTSLTQSKERATT